jgi:hypothetical protein
MSQPISSNNQQDEALNGVTLSYAPNANCHNLPVEIWRQIFEESVAHIPRALAPFSAPLDPLEQRRHYYIGISVSHVCRYFRHIALSTPILWSTLNFDSSEIELKTFLERSAQLPLTITSVGDLFSTVDSQHVGIFKAIAARIVNINSPIERGSFEKLKVCKNLKHIMLRGNSGYEKSNVEIVLNQFESLESLCWTNAFNETVTLSSQKKYALRSLHLLFRVPDKCLLSILRCCPALETVSAHVIGTTDTEDDQDVRLPRLRDLRVKFSSEDSWLCKLNVPIILDYYEFSYHLPFPQSSYHQWDMRMKSLVLGEFFDLPLLVSWLSSEPGFLKTLTLSLQFRPDQRRVLQALKADGTRTLCPQLEEVRIQYLLPLDQLERVPDYTRSDYEELFYDIYSSRAQAGLPPLRFIWNGVVVVPKQRVVAEPESEPSVETSDTEETILHPRLERKQSVFEQVPKASPIIKGVERSWSKLRETKMFR